MSETVTCPVCGMENKMEKAEDGASIVCAGCKQSIQINKGKKDSPTVLHPESLSVEQSRNDEFAAGTIIGKCKIEKLLGRGGMGAVYLARHQTLDIPVAVKVLLPEIAKRKPQFADRFLREARLAAKISHPNVMGVMDADRDSETGVHYIVLEYVDGGSVRDLMEQGRIDLEKALDITLAVGEALVAAGQLDIIHRDIKPDNIMLTSDGKVKLADLGLAKQTGGASNDMTATQAIMGTPAYMSPEQARDTRSVDARADIYSLGATFYHMLAGTPPFDGDSAFDILTKLATEPMPDPRSKRRDIPESVAAICLKMTEKDNKQRYQNAQDLVDDLRKVKYGDRKTASSLKAAGFAKGRPSLKTKNISASLLRDASSGASFASHLHEEKKTSDTPAPKIEFENEKKKQAQDGMIEVKCRACQASVMLPESMRGKSGKCPICDAVVSVPGGKKKKSDKKVTVVCKKCKSKIAVSEKMLGKKLECPKCKAPLKTSSNKKKKSTRLKAGDNTPSKPGDIDRKAFNAWEVMQKAKEDSFWVAMWKAALYPFQTLGALFFFVLILPAIISSAVIGTVILAGPTIIATPALGVTGLSIALLIEILTPMAFFSSFILALIRVSSTRSLAVPVIQGMNHKGNLFTMVGWAAVYFGVPTLLCTFRGGVLLGAPLGFCFSILAPIGLLLCATLTPTKGLNPIRAARFLMAAPGQYFYMIFVCSLLGIIFHLIGMAFVSAGMFRLFTPTPDYYSGIPMIAAGNILSFFPFVILARSLGLFLYYHQSEFPENINVSRVVQRGGGEGAFVPALIGIILFGYFIRIGLGQSGAVEGAEIVTPATQVEGQIGQIHKTLLEKGYPKTQEEFETTAGKENLSSPILPGEKSPYIFYPVKKDDPATFIWFYERRPTLAGGEQIPKTRAVSHSGQIKRIAEKKLRLLLGIQADYIKALDAEKDRLIKQHELEWKKGF